MRKGTPWLLWLAVGLLVLLAVAAVLQYRWLGEVSEAGRQRMQSTLKARAEQFAEEFDRDIARAFFWLQVEPDVAEKKDWGRYAERYDRWLAGSARPRLVREIWLLTPGNAPQRFNPDARAFEAAPVPRVLEPFWQDAAAEFRDPQSGSRTGVRWFHAIREDIPAIVVPVPQFVTTTPQKDLHVEEFNPLARAGFTVLLLDDEYLRREMLPQLAARHFGTAESSEYHVTIASRGTNTPVFSYGPASQPASGSPDTTLSFFDIRLDALAEVRAGARGGRTAAPGAESVVLPPTVIIRTQPGDALHGSPTPQVVDRRMAFSVVQRDRQVKTAALPVPGPRWDLVIRHRAGSLEAAVSAGKRRNLVLSSGILALFASSIILLVMSVRRASHLAAQQIEFVAAVSHELRTPLAVIRSAGDNLADGLVTDAEQVRRYGDLVRSEGLRLSAMVEQVLAFAGMSGGQALRRAPEHVRNVIDRAIAAAATDLEAAALRVEVDVPADLPPLSIDGDAMARAIGNLLTNAAKYAAGGGVVRVSAALATGRPRDVQISVEDRGPGIAAEDLPRIFEPFFRGAAVVASSVHGSGLGLSLVQAIVRAHDGHVSVASEPGRGSTFTVHLPYLASKSAMSAAEPVPASRT